MDIYEGSSVLNMGKWARTGRSNLWLFLVLSTTLLKCTSSILFPSIAIKAEASCYNENWYKNEHDFSNFFLQTIVLPLSYLYGINFFQIDFVFVNGFMVVRVFCYSFLIS